MKHKRVTRPNTAQDWKKIDWGRVQRNIFAIQCAIYHATKSDNSERIHQLQRKLTRSFNARALAVRKVSIQSSGKKTAGPDGLKNPSPAACYDMASRLRLSHQPSPPRHIEIPKPGTDEMRKLSIPNLTDRAHQELIRMALDPQWEARFPTRMFGFRRGRGQQDARRQIELTLGKNPAWVLDADISKFFDCINRNALMDLIDSTSAIRKAIVRTLNTLGEPADDGIPQGGPLCPLLANIVMTGLPAHIEESLRSSGIAHSPKSILYADDLLIIHKDRPTVEQAEVALVTYLDKFDLKLNTKKTKLRHTLAKTVDGEKAGFNFIGFRFQHFDKPRYNEPDKALGDPPYLIVRPSDKSVANLLNEIRALIKGTLIIMKHRGASRCRRDRKGTDQVSIMILRLNKRLKGWTNYYRHCNAKRTFSKIDHRTFQALLHWGQRRFKHKSATWRKEHLFSGVETDSYGKPLRRRDGELRERDWAFKSPFAPRDREHVTVIKASDTPTGWSPPMVKITRSYYDGDWHYWGGRSDSYPNIPKGINKAALKRQLGKCDACKARFERGDQLVEVTCTKNGAPVRVLVHSHCHPSV
ncbi:reverse transcriptase domain-containing protein [Roseibacillus ishigakijimensis]|uniref:Reverse transcriptase N-terminal domain-containing protein n=1 Tax=Roseibacillus ishigakijimensis TaxID=454146 RepID=A0A934VM99_9BACT|nr:reverse transcriptase domain-containing protein [Roseibacillus ishigakijimensis]MBK1835534.1 reverse transcriptase N-terminal domain-containing protein [Roseibacillus ishigakijimensis]